jgi:hypothetical protein
LVAKIIALIMPHVRLESDQGSTETLVVNERLMIACRVAKEQDGYSLYLFDQITGNSLQITYNFFVDRNEAIEEAHTAVGLSETSLLFATDIVRLQSVA